MRRYIGIAALSLALAFGLSISNVSADAPPTEEEVQSMLAEVEATFVNIEELKGEKQYRVLEPTESGEELNWEKAAEEVGAGE